MKHIKRFAWLFFVMNIACAGFSSEKAPAFNTTDINGNPVVSDEFIGKNPTLLIFWAQWCVLCKAEMPKLRALHDEYSEKGLKIVAVNRDNPDDKDLAIKYVENTNLPFTIVTRAKRIHYKYKALTIPFIVAIDANGDIMEKGFSLDEMETAINAMTKSL